MTRSDGRSTGGQTLVLFSLVLVVIILVVGLVVDGGYALSQRRGAQNAADFAAIAGTRVVQSAGTDANAVIAIEAALAANGARVANGSKKLYTAQYVDNTGGIVAGAVGTFGSGSVPSTARGVEVDASRTWTPYFLGVIGVTSWSAGASGVARSPGVDVGSGVFPFAINKLTFDHGTCPKGKKAGSTSDPGCTIFDLTTGNLNLSGGFGWLKFGCDTSFGLGQNGGNCANSKGSLDTEWGALPTTLPNTFGCCTSVSGSKGSNLIGSLPGNKASVNDSQPSINFYETNQLAGWVPVFDTTNGNGSGGTYHIVGYAALEITHIKGSKDIQGVLRYVSGVNGYDAPDLSLTQPPGGAVQLVH
jgi:Flp pilus assembly protein TadG